MPGTRPGTGDAAVSKTSTALSSQTTSPVQGTAMTMGAMAAQAGGGGISGDSKEDWETDQAEEPAWGHPGENMR